MPGSGVQLRPQKNSFFFQFGKKRKKRSPATVNTRLIIKEHDHGKGSVRALSQANGYNEKIFNVNQGRMIRQKKRKRKIVIM